MNVLFVCTGNTCRSPMAEALFRSMLVKEKIRDVTLISRGLSATDGQPASPGTREALREVGIELGESFARRLAFRDIDEADLVLAMEQRHVETLLTLYPKAAGKVFLFKDYTEMEGNSRDVPDPMGGSLADYQKCRIELQDGLLGLLTKLKRPSSPRRRPGPRT